MLERRPCAGITGIDTLGDYIHSKGLKFGIYSSPGPKTCGGYEDSYRHEEEDARSYAERGVDFVKYDWCSAAEVYKPEQMLGAYRKMYGALQRAGRPMVYSLCQYARSVLFRLRACYGTSTDIRMPAIRQWIFKEVLFANVEWGQVHCLANQG